VNDERIKKNENEISKIWKYLHKKEAEKYKRVGNIRINKGVASGLFVSFTFGVIKLILPNVDIQIPVVTESKFMEYLKILIDWIQPKFLFVVPILLGAGWVLKNYSKVSNELIAIILLVFVSFPICSIAGSFITDATGWESFFEIVVEYGVSQGVLVTAFAVIAYDVFHGVGKYRRDRKKEVSNNG